MQNPTIVSEIIVSTPPVDSGERFLSQIRLFLAFKKGAGRDTEREEFLLECLAEMHHSMNRQRTPIEVFPVPPVIQPTSYELSAF